MGDTADRDPPLPLGRVGRWPHHCGDRRQCAAGRCLAGRHGDVHVGWHEGDRLDGCPSAFDWQPAPTAKFAATCSSLQCTFDASGSNDPDGDIVDYQWDFGDGTTASGPSATHTFASDGVFEVTLTVSDDKAATATSTQSLSVSLAVVAFRAANSSNVSSSTASVVVPAAGPEW